VPDDGDELPELPDWSASGGPDVFTLRAWLAAERAREQGQPLDDTVNFMQDRVAAIFGGSVFVRFSRFLEERGIGDDAVLLDDEALLQQLLAFLLEDDEAPEPPSTDFMWSAYEPGDPAGSRKRFRRAVRRRRIRARAALLLPRRPRVAGERSR
jgi:hypothetical protein